MADVRQTIYWIAVVGRGRVIDSGTLLNIAPSGVACVEREPGERYYVAAGKWSTDPRTLVDKVASLPPGMLEE